VVPLRLRLVLDTNVLLRGLLNPRSAAGRVVDACDRRAVLLVLSAPVLAEYWAVLSDPSIVERYAELTHEKVELALRRLRYVGDVFRIVRTRFEYPRDPKDAKFVELAITGRATHIVSGDGDLLSLPAGKDDASKRFRQRLPRVEVLTPSEFLERYADRL